MNASNAARRSASADEAARDEALEEAFARHQGQLLGTLYYLVGNVEDARDALQETFIKCWRRRDRTGQIENLKAWIFRIAMNTGRDLRAGAWRRRRKQLGDGEMTIETTHPGPASGIERREDLARVRTAIAALRPEEQEVFLLRQNGEMTYEEIGRSIGIPTGTAKTRMRLALGKLRVVLADR